MVINLSIYANIFTLWAFLCEIEQFYWYLFWPGSHFGPHFGRHFEFMGHNFTIHVFLLFHVVEQGQKHTPRCYYFYPSCIFKWDRVISMFPALTRAMVILAAILDLRTPIEIYMTFDCFRWLNRVENIYIDAFIFTLSSFLSEIEQFHFCRFWPGGYLGRHLE